MMLNDLADAMVQRFRAMVLLAGYRGLRWGEIAGLRRNRVNLLKSRVEVNEILVEVRGDFSFGPPKTAQGRRTIPLPQFLTEALATHMEEFSVGDFVFTGDRGSLLHRSNFARSFWRPAVAAAGVNPDLTFHGLRHTAGVDPRSGRGAAQRAGLDHGLVAVDGGLDGGPLCPPVPVPPRAPDQPSGRRFSGGGTQEVIKV
jgi:integrase